MKRILALAAVDQVNKKVSLFGWVNSVRKHVGVVFIDLRDRSGIIQLVGKKDMVSVSKEDVVNVIGTVKNRGEQAVNKKIATGGVEVEIKSIEVLSKSQPLPFDIYGPGLEIDERVRLDYRYLDLRRPRLQENIRFRAKMMNAFRQSLVKREFIEIETPLLTKSTPEGARDFLVPSRMHPGKFYALPQSPQQYKQLLMVAGFERYFQMTRCLRDEDLRANRSYEFTQVDVEMSFMTRNEIIDLMEEVVIEVYESLGLEFVSKPFPRITYSEAMKKYDDDKFDIRTEADKKAGKLGFAWVIDFPLFEQTETRELNPNHHPFTALNPEDIKLLDTAPEKVRSWQYDLICNGHEVAGGSVRITDPKIQEKIFKVLGHKQKDIEEKFGHLLKAFTYGVPPHGGIAFGLGRHVMISKGENSLREVSAFPINSNGQTSVMDAPNTVEKSQLKELGIKVITHAKTKGN